MRGSSYNHLYYFWTVAREGGVARAAEALHLTPQTISSQLPVLEDSLGVQLFRRSGRQLVLTDSGRLALTFADEIFRLGSEMGEALKGRASGRPLQFSVGVVDVVPKAVAYRLLEPALRLPEPVRILCREGKLDALLADIAIHKLDMVLADTAIGSARLLVPTLQRGNAVLAAPAARCRMRRQSVGICSHAGAWEPGEGSATPWRGGLPCRWGTSGPFSFPRSSVGMPSWPLQRPEVACDAGASGLAPTLERGSQEKADLTTVTLTAAGPTPARPKTLPAQIQVLRAALSALQCPASPGDLAQGSACLFKPLLGFIG